MRLLVLLLLYVCKVLADVSVTVPKPGSSYAASGGEVEIEIQWTDDETTPLLDEIIEYKLSYVLVRILISYLLTLWVHSSLPR